MPAPSLDAVLERLESWPSYIGAPHGMALVFVLKRLLVGKDGAPGALERLRRLLASHDRLIAQLPRCGCEDCAYLRDATEELAKLLGMEE